MVWTVAIYDGHFDEWFRTGHPTREAAEDFMRRARDEAIARASDPATEGSISMGWMDVFDLARSYDDPIARIELREG